MITKGRAHTALLLKRFDPFNTAHRKKILFLIVIQHDHHHPISLGAPAHRLSAYLAVPFLIAVPFYGNNGTLLIDPGLLKSIIIVVATITAAILMVWFFSEVTTEHTREAVITGFVWLFINWVLDTIILVGLMGMAPPDYVTQIGLELPDDACNGNRSWDHCR